jgi:hypothetical protein
MCLGQSPPRLPRTSVGAPAAVAGAYDAWILLKTHVPVSDTVSDTSTLRILPDTYSRHIGNSCEFK